MTARVTNCGRLTHRYGDITQGCSEVNLTLWMTFVVGTWQATLLHLFFVFFPFITFLLFSLSAWYALYFSSTGTQPDFSAIMSLKEICSISRRSRVLAHRPCPKLEMLCPSVLQLFCGCSKVLMTNHGMSFLFLFFCFSNRLEIRAQLP